MAETIEKNLTLNELKELANGQPVSKLFGFKVLELAPGYAKVSIKMRPEN